jgi:hypothetical protein
VFEDKKWACKEAMAYCHCGVTCESAIPIGLAINLDGLKHRWQASRRKQDVRRELSIAEHPSAAGAHIGGGHEQLYGGLCYALEIDAVCQDPGQRVDPTRIEIVGRERASHEVEGKEQR